jgi:multisite-specific tRNA:(cytosine-C5)-methyltransferase
LVHTGVRAFVRNEGSNEQAFRYRIQADGLNVLAPFLGDARKVKAQLEDLRKLVEQQNPLIESMSPHTRERLEAMRKSDVNLIDWTEKLICVQSLVV